MKQLITFLALAIICSNATAQKDSTKNTNADTIRIGGIIIIKNGKDKNDNHKDWDDITMGRNNTERKKNANVSTNWFILDIGFSGYDDKTNYANVPAPYFANRPGQPVLGANDFKLRTGKSLNVNIWFFMQRLNLIEHHINLKYGLGLELNNYAYKSNISYKESGVSPYPPFTNNTGPYILRDSISFSKNKMAADYITVPFMLNFTSNPGNRNKGLSISAGVSAGYLYSQRNKQKSSERGKDKNRGDYDVEKFKLSYVAELGLGPIRLYGSYSPKSLYSNSLDMRPYNVGLRFSNW
jgi:Outer membrane protein beta-barrel domain